MHTFPLSQHLIYSRHTCTHSLAHKVSHWQIPILQKRSHLTALCLSVLAEQLQLTWMSCSPDLAALVAWCMHRGLIGMPEEWRTGSAWWDQCTWLAVVSRGRQVAVGLCVVPEGRCCWRCCGLWRWRKFVNTFLWQPALSLVEHPFKQKAFNIEQLYFSQAKLTPARKKRKKNLLAPFSLPSRSQTC